MFSHRKLKTDWVTQLSSYLPHGLETKSKYSPFQMLALCSPLGSVGVIVMEREVDSTSWCAAQARPELMTSLQNTCAGPNCQAVGTICRHELSTNSVSMLNMQNPGI